MTILKIFLKDVRNVLKNKVAIGIVIGLCIIPSLYTWITLKANWNPYVDTGNVPVAVVNNDAGTIINNKIVNFGTMTVNQLAHNNTIKWTFVGQAVANQGLKDGQYYAMIEIPSDFSQDLQTIYTGNPVKPDLIYKVNQKTNAIAAKITDLASNQLQEQIKQTFFDNVNQAILTEGNTIGKKIETNKPMILEVKNVIAQTNNNIGNIINNVSSSNQNVKQLSAYLTTLRGNLPQITSELTRLQGVVKSSQDLIKSTQNNLNSLKSNIDSINNSMTNANNTLVQNINTLKQTVASQVALTNQAIADANAANKEAEKNADENTNKAKQAVNGAKSPIQNGVKVAKDATDGAKTVVGGVNNIADKGKAAADKAINTVNQNTPENVKKVVDKYLNKDEINKDKEIINNAMQANKQLENFLTSAANLLNTLSQLTDNNSFENIIQILNNMETLVNDQYNKLSNLNNSLSNTANITADSVNQKLGEIEGLSNDLTQLLNNFATQYATSVDGSIAKANTNLTESLNNVNGILDASSQMIPELKAIANVGISTSDMSIQKTNELSNKLQSLNNNLEALRQKTENLNNNDLNNLINVLNKNPQQLASLLSSPVGVNVQELYGMSIFGIGLAPFYTVLSIWVGALLCTTIIGVNKEVEEDGTKKRIMQIHFARMILFIIINFVQATIVTLGDIYILGIHPANFWMLMGFAWFSGLVFTVIIFTFVSLSGNFGKALALVVMVVQVAGSGAIYPIQVNPEIFQKFEFIWPFTYAIDGFRQAIGGADWTNVRTDIIWLTGFLIVFIMIGFVKMFTYKQANIVERLFKESEL
ncbi:MAG: YhgE/Pip family protein [Sarcina sp.]